MLNLHAYMPKYKISRTKKQNVAVIISMVSES